MVESGGLRRLLRYRQHDGMYEDAGNPGSGSLQLGHDFRRPPADVV